MFAGLIIVISGVVGMNFASLLFPQLGQSNDTRKVLEELDLEMEDSTSENSSFISIEFPLRNNDSSEQQMLSIVDTGKGELDIGHPFAVKDPVRNIVYSIFPRSWKDEAARQLACKGEGENLTQSCVEFLENEKWCPKQSRVCVLDLGKSNRTLDECSSNSNCSAGYRCCFDRCENATLCKPEKRIPMKRTSDSFDDEASAPSTASPVTDTIVDTQSLQISSRRRWGRPSAVYSAGEAAGAAPTGEQTAGSSGGSKQQRRRRRRQQQQQQQSTGPWEAATAAEVVGRPSGIGSGSSSRQYPAAVGRAAPITFQFANESTKFVLFPENWNDDEQCQKKCQANNGTLECCLQDIKERQKLCPTSSERLCVLYLGEDEVDRCENDENCPEGRKCCYDRCHDDTVCKRVRRKKDY